MACRIFMRHIFARHIFCHIFTYSNEQNTSSHSQSTQQSATLISDPETCNLRKRCTIKCNWESCLKIEQCGVENNASLEASCERHGVRRRYYTRRKAQPNSFPDGVVFFVPKIHAGRPGSLLPISDELLRHVFEYVNRGLMCHHVSYVARHLICAMTFRENQKGPIQM